MASLLLRRFLVTQPSNFKQQSHNFSIFQPFAHACAYFGHHHPGLPSPLITDWHNPHPSPGLVPPLPAPLVCSPSTFHQHSTHMELCAHTHLFWANTTSTRQTATPFWLASYHQPLGVLCALLEGHAGPCFHGAVSAPVCMSQSGVIENHAISPAE